MVSRFSNRWRVLRRRCLKLATSIPRLRYFNCTSPKRGQRRSGAEYSVRLAFRQKRSAKEITRLMPRVSHRSKKVSAAVPTSPSSDGADYGRPGDLQSIGTRPHAKYPPPAPLFHWVPSQCHIRRKLSWPVRHWSRLAWLLLRRTGCTQRAISEAYIHARHSSQARGPRQIARLQPK